MQDIVANVGILLFFLSLIYMISGLINPKALIFKNIPPLSRIRILLLGFIACMISASLITSKQHSNNNLHDVISNLTPYVIVFLIVLFWDNVKENLKRRNGNSQQELIEFSNRMNNILTGSSPRITPSLLLLKPKEYGIFETQAVLAENIKSREYVAGNAGISIRLAKGITYRTGGTKGKFITNTEETPVAEGFLTVTSERVVFTGADKTFSVPYNKLISYSQDGNRIVINVENRNIPYIVYIFSKEILLVDCAIKHARNNIQEDM